MDIQSHFHLFEAKFVTTNVQLVRGKGGRGKGKGGRSSQVWWLNDGNNSSEQRRDGAASTWCRHDAAALGTEEKHCSEGRKEEMLNVVDSI